MKTFEEKWTAWLDDQLTGRELADFEASLPDRVSAEAEKHGAHQLRTLLKRELGAELSNAEFFSHQLRERITRESATPDRSGARPGWWTLPRMVWTGATALAMFVLFTVIAVRDQNPAEQSTYLSQIMNARVDPAVSPNATVTMFESPEDRVTVLWTEGLQSLPADYAAK